MTDVSSLDVSLQVRGSDGYVLEDANNMRQFRRGLDEIVDQLIGPYNQFPDGVALMLGAMAASGQDRDVPGAGFTHKIDDIVTIRCPRLGTPVNRVAHTDKIPPWEFGVGELMHNLAQRGLLA